MKIKFLKTKDWKLFTRFLKYFKPHKVWIIFSMISIPIATGAGLVFLWLIEKIIDVYIIPGDLPGLVLYAIYLAITLVVILLFDAIYGYTFAKAGNLAVFDLRKELFAKTLRFPFRYFDNNPIGVTLSRLTSDMEALTESFASGILGLITDFIKTVALLSYLFYLNWELTIVVLLAVPPIYLITRFLRKKLRFAYNNARTSLAKSAAYLQEALSGIKTIQLYSAEEETYRRYSQLNKDFCSAQNKSNVFDSALYSIVEGITSIAVGLVIWYGATQIWDMEFTIGVLIVFIITLNRLFVPVKQFASQISTIQRSLSAIEHINELFEQDEEEDETKINRDIFDDNVELQEIEFRNVSFKYRPEDEDVLKNVSFKLTKGQRIALVGGTGSGKSTVIKVLTKAYDGYRGSITINGIELSKIPLKNIHEMVSAMQQDIYMFNDSVGFNIALGRDNVSDDDIAKSAEFVYADKFIDDLPEKYNYQVQDNGANLSKGQAQLISFARAICGKSELIILDEATSAVDSLTEQYIQKAIENIFSSKTVIAIAHRLSTIRHSDVILVLENGEIIERGNHTELLSKGGKYSQLINEISKND